MMSYVVSGRDTKESESLSSICMSVALRSCAARTLSSLSGWEDSEGGERSNVRRVDVGTEGFGGAGEKSEALWRVTEGGMAEWDLLEERVACAPVVLFRNHNAGAKNI